MPQHSIINKAIKDLPKNAAVGTEKLLSKIFENISEDDLSFLDIDSICRVALNHNALLSKGKKPGQALVLIETPSVEGDDVLKTTIDIINDDMPFLVDSISAEITRHNRIIEFLIHPILKEDGPKGKVARSHVHIRLKGVVPESRIKVLQKDLERVCKDVYFATRDWQKMMEKLRLCQISLSKAPDKYNELDIEEYLHFLEYLYQDNFTFLGVREYKFIESKGQLKSQTVRGSSLGLLSNEMKPVYINQSKVGLTENLQKLRRNLDPVSVSKVNKISTVHRGVPLDAIAIKQFDDNGAVVGECLFIGLFTSVTYSRSIQDVPYLRRIAAQVTHLSGFEPGSHDYKALRHILEKYPRDELFQIDPEDLLKKALSILKLQERPRVALYTRADPFERYVSCLVYVPKERYDTQFRVAVQRILEEELNGECGNFYTTLDDSALARVMFIIYVDQKNKRKYNEKKIEKKLQIEGRRWNEILEDALIELKYDNTEDQNAKLVYKYQDSFSAEYRQRYNGKQAIYDIEKVEDVLKTNKLALDLYHSNDCESWQVRLKLYHYGAPIKLSSVIPVLENMGYLIDSEWPFEVCPKGEEKSVWIHDFLLERNIDDELVSIKEIKQQFEEAIFHIWYGEMENDSLNRLVIDAKMDWREIVILRAYIKYLRQTNQPYSSRFLMQTLTKNPNISRTIVDLFFSLFDPQNEESTDILAAGCSVEIDHALENVLSLDEDRVLRSIVGLVEATLRTNFFQLNSQGHAKSYLSLKLDSNAIEELPQPRPYREIFVYSPRVEGVHLRGDRIARGGIRWSDRLEDYRTEILGLKKAQQVKNSLIVPMGAKGGFVVKQPPTEGGKQAFLDEGIECYKIFIRGLLDITDNQKGSRILPPKDVLRRDDDDPYLVVAADKGTATFSDIANSLSEEYGFWLGDAFASGGSAGYDHKKMGITARGAWESVKRHFRELGHDTQSKEFRVVGVGDMSGDVFGNGMLLSKHICLFAAFNHMHIFCDPNPDPVASYKERQRLFNNVKGWGEYNTKLLSQGGRIYNRTDKSVKLTAEIKKALDVDKDILTPNELIKAILKARTDLLWFGGIGTYIKASQQTHMEVGDKANDPVRIDASELRCNVMGEGANLAITQKGRVEFAERGGKINADFIDNSGGVDSSDHEVNIKILLSSIMEKKDNTLTLKKRNKLLSQMTDEVATLVLKHNYHQSQAISLMSLNSSSSLALHEKFIKDLEKNEGLKRDLEGLPDEEEIEKRLREGRGLNRPELSTIQAYAKILFTRDLLRTDIPDQMEMEERLINYFPIPLRKRFKSEILGHRLKREIIATTLATGVVNRMGPTFVKAVMNKVGVGSSDVARAYIIVRDAFSLRPLWDQIESLDNKVLAEVQLKALKDISTMAERETIWFLTRLGRSPEISTDIKQFKSGINELRKTILSIAPKRMETNIRQRIEKGMNDGLPKDLAESIALIPSLGAACDIVCIARDLRMSIKIVAEVYFQIGEFFHMDWLRRQAKFMSADDKWSLEALEGIVDQLDACQAGLTKRMLGEFTRQIKRMAKSKEKDQRHFVKGWIEQCAPHASQIETLFEEIRQAGTIDLSMLIIAEQRLRNLYGG